jgi:sugar phosphate permease
MKFPFENSYYGWKNLLGSFFCAAVAIGFTTYVFGMFALPVTEEFGISRADFNNGMIAFMVGMAVMSPIVGHLLDRYSARKLLLAGGIIYAGSLMLLSRLDSLWLMLLLISLPLAFATAASGVICANTVTVRWFRRRRGRALGIVALSTSVGGFVIQPLTAVLIESLGWRDALFTLGLIALLIFLTMGILIIRDRPQGTEPGYAEEFSAAADEGASPAAVAGQDREWGKGELFRSRNFWVLAICTGLLFAIDQAVLVSQVPYFQDIGYDLTTAAILVSVKTISAICGKLLIGYLADKVDLRFLFIYVAGSNALLMTIYIIQPAFPILLVSVALLGVAVGGVFPVWTTLMAWLFGSRSYGTVMGFISILIQPMAVVALRFVGEMHDRTGSYVPAFSVFVGLALFTIALVWMLRPEMSPASGSTAVGQVDNA